MAFKPSDLPKDSAKLAEFLKTLNAAQLAEAETALNAELDAAQDRVGENGSPDPDLATMTILVEKLQAIRSETEGRAADVDAKVAEAAKLRESLAPKAETPEPAEDAPADDDADDDSSDGNGDSGDGDADGDADDDSGDEAGVSEQVEAVAASAKEMMATITAAFANLPRLAEPPKAELVVTGGPSLNRHLRLGAAAKYAPNAQVPEHRAAGSVLVASSDIPGLSQGSALHTDLALANAMHQRVRNMGVSRSGDPEPALVATLQRDFEYTLSENSTFEEVDAVLKAATDVDAMVAAGGWCAPSAISYDFFNLVCEEGLVDLPSVGVLNRGGFRFPTSPTFADVIAGSPDGLWTWTETDDQSAVTGAPVKDCVRVPCPAFNDVRLACDGFCITGGNLMDFAFPENIANWIRLVMAARAHVTNSRVISIMNQASVQHDLTGLNPNRGVFGAIIEAMAFEAADQRARFATCSDQIVEFLAPEWLLGAIKADFAYRTGIDNPIMVDSMLIDAFDSLNVRVQFVQDYQVRAAGQFGATTAPTAWPLSVQMLAYLPGTFVRGQGLNLNLGVVRDSVLNSTNDFTAAWAEDCYAVAQVGWLSRRIVLDLCVAGTTGAANITC